MRVWNRRKAALVGLPSRTVDVPSLRQSLARAPASLRARQTPTRRAIAITSALVVLAVGCGQSGAPSAARSTASSIAPATHESSTGGSIRFPATLLGLHENTSASAEQIIRSITGEFKLLGLFSHTQAAIYGTFSASNLFVVGVTELTAAAKKYGTKLAAGSLRRGFLAQGSSDSRLFAAGSRGAGLACGHMTRGGATEIVCIRYDKRFISLAVYFPGFTSSVSDAAAKTNQAISAIGG